jgi:hypothetical protein
MRSLSASSIKFTSLIRSPGTKESVHAYGSEAIALRHSRYRVLGRTSRFARHRLARSRMNVLRGIPAASHLPLFSLASERTQQWPRRKTPPAQPRHAGPS